MKIVVCGGFGYIGASFVLKLIKDKSIRNKQIVIFDNWSYGRGAAPLNFLFQKYKNIKIYSHDISNNKLNSYKRFKSEVISCNYFINLASLTQVPDTILHHKYIVNGVKNISSILNKNKNIKKIIDISSTSIYGSVKFDKSLLKIKEPYAETVFPNPKFSLHSYASSKLKAEKIWLKTKLPYLVLRLSTVYGYGPGLRYNQFINSFIIDSLLGKKIIVPGDPKNFRPFVHINDLTNIFIKLLLCDAKGEILNIGSKDQNIKLDEIYKIVSKQIKKITSVKCKYSFESKYQKPKINESYIVSFDKFKKLLNYKFRYNFENSTTDYLKCLNSNETKF